MTSLLWVLLVLGIGPPVAYAGGWDLAGPQAGSFAWSYSDRSTSYGFGSDEFGDWSYGEIRLRQPVVDWPAPRTYSSGGGVFFEGAPLVEVPAWRERWPRRQKIKIKIKNRRW